MKFNMEWGEYLGREVKIKYMHLMEIRIPVVPGAQT